MPAWAGMRTASKNSALLIILLIATSSCALLAAEPADAQSITKPPTPEFSLQLADHSYDVPERTTSTIDPYTGKTITQTYPAYHIQNLTIDIVFKNPNYPKAIDGNEAVLFYDIEIKPHFTQDWYGSGKGWFRADTTSQYTTVSFPRCNFPSEGQVDFRAQLYSGYYYDYIDHSHIQDIPQRTFLSEASDWSNTQTIDLSDGSITVSPSANPITTPPPSPTVTSTTQTGPDVTSPTFIPVIPTFVWLAIVAVLGSMLVLIVVIRFKMFNH